MLGLLVSTGLAQTTAAGGLTRFEYTEYHMGMDTRLVVYTSDQKTAEDACRSAYARVAELEAIMSDYRKDSELMQLCAKAGGPAVKVSPELYRVLRRAVEVSEFSQGAFDVTVGPLVQIWRKARKTGVLPEKAEIEAARKLVGYEKMHLDPRRRTVRLDVPGMRLDLGGIAKGYAGDEAIRILKSFGINRALFVMGGDIVTSGPPPGREGWRIRVPNAGDDKGPKDLLFAHKAVSTSGDTEQFVVIGGVQYSHVVDPRTGWALTNRIQATVIAPNGLLADPLSKVFTVSEPTKIPDYEQALIGMKVYIRSLADKKGDGLQSWLPSPATCAL